MNKINLIVIRPGRYNNAQQKAAIYQEGDVLVTAEPYALSLIESGFARLATAGERQEPGGDKEVLLIGERSETRGDDFTKVSGISADLAQELTKYGIRTMDDLKKALVDGTIINVPGFGLRKRAALRKTLGV